MKKKNNQIMSTSENRTQPEDKKQKKITMNKEEEN